MTEYPIDADAPGTLSVIEPFVAPAGTTAVICVSELIVNVASTPPLNRTWLTAERPTPEITTIVPAGPAFGVTLCTPKGVKSPGGRTDTLPFTTVIGPLSDPLAGTRTVRWPSSTTVRFVPGTPLKSTAVTPVSPDPVIVTGEPTSARRGEKPLTEKEIVSGRLEVAVPEGVCTVSGPVVAPAGTVT